MVFPQRMRQAFCSVYLEDMYNEVSIDLLSLARKSCDTEAKNGFQRMGQVFGPVSNKIYVMRHPSYSRHMPS